MTVFIVLAVGRGITWKRVTMLTSSDTTPAKNSSRDNFYRLHVHFERGGDYDVYYRTPLAFSLANVPKYAVRDGDLLDVFMPNVNLVEKIAPEEYFEYMWE